MDDPYWGTPRILWASPRLGQIRNPSPVGSHHACGRRRPPRGPPPICGQYGAHQETPRPYPEDLRNQDGDAPVGKEARDAQRGDLDDLKWGKVPLRRPRPEEGDAKSTVGERVEHTVGFGRIGGPNSPAPLIASSTQVQAGTRYQFPPCGDGPHEIPRSIAIPGKSKQGRIEHLHRQQSAA